MNKRMLALIALPLAVAACSSGDEPKGVEMTGPQGSSVTPLSVTGPAVDDGLICAAVTMEQSNFADLDGNSLTMEEVAAIAEESTDFVWTETYTCEDGSGTFTALGEQLIPMSEMDFDGGVNEGAARSTVQTGTGDYESLTGEWEWSVDFAAQVITVTGEVHNE